MIKRTLFIFLLSCYFLIGNAQQAIIYGFVKNIANNNGIGNHQVEIISHYDSISNSGMNYYSSIFTASNGFFIDSVSIPTGQNILFEIKTLDCNNNSVVDSFYSGNPAPLNLFICNNNGPSCLAQFLAYADTTNFKRIFFYNISSQNTNTYNWDFGDGQTSNAKNPVHLYASQGVYHVKLIAKDTLINCVDSIIDTLVVAPQINCQNGFSFSSNLLLANFNGFVNNTLPTIYKWDFGDFSYATGQNPSHTFAHAGIFKVCMTSISINPMNLDTCSSTICQYVTIQAPPMGNLWGQVFAGTQKVDKATVELFRYSNQSSKYIPFDTVDVTVIDSLNLSFYYIPMIPYGNYILKAKLSQTSTFYDDFAPSYSGNQIAWTSAVPIQLNSIGNAKPIHLLPMSSSTGPVSVEGYVLEGNQKNPGDPVPNVLLYLYDIQGDIYGYQYTDAQGHYQFQGLDYKKYFIYADLINLNIFPAYIWPDESQNHLQNVNIYVHKNTVTSIHSEASNLSTRIYPNPVTDFLYCNFDLNGTQKLTFKIYTIQGNLIHQETKDQIYSNQTVKLDLHHLNTGMYFLEIESENEGSYRSKILIHNR